MNYIIVFKLDNLSNYNIITACTKRDLKQKLIELKESEKDNLEYYYLCTIDDIRLNKKLFPTMKNTF